MIGNNDNGKAAFATYRVGDVGDDMAPALQRALDAHLQRYGRHPAGITVNKTLIGKAREALEALGRPALPVETSGGCLAWEVWLAVTEAEQPAPEPEEGS